MELGNTINLPIVNGIQGLVYTLPDSETNRRVKVYQVPESVSSDRYYISIIQPGAVEAMPPCRGKDTLLLVDYSQDQAGDVKINYINEEIKNA